MWALWPTIIFFPDTIYLNFLLPFFFARVFGWPPGLDPHTIANQQPLPYDTQFVHPTIYPTHTPTERGPTSTLLPGHSSACQIFPFLFYLFFLLFPIHSVASLPILLSGTRHAHSRQPLAQTFPLLIPHSLQFRLHSQNSNPASSLPGLRATPPLS